jgi:hypothetical protein
MISSFLLLPSNQFRSASMSRCGSCKTARGEAPLQKTLTNGAETGSIRPPSITEADKKSERFKPRNIMQIRKTVVSIVAGAILFAAAVKSTAVTYLNFDSVSAGSGVDATAYLLSAGITLANLSNPGTVDIISDQNYYGSGVVTAPSPHNFLMQNVGGSPNGITYTMDFSTPLTSLSFTRISINAPSLVAQWTATAYAGVTAVGSVGEGLFGGSEASQTYTLSGAGITSLTITANGFNAAGIPSAPLDDFYLTQVPEPGTLALLGVGALVTVLRARRAGR